MYLASSRSLDLNDKGEGKFYIYIYVSGFVALRCKCTNIARRVECILNVVINEFSPYLSKRFLADQLNNFFSFKAF